MLKAKLTKQAKRDMEAIRAGIKEGKKTKQFTDKEFIENKESVIKAIKGQIFNLNRDIENEIRFIEESTHVETFNINRLYLVNAILKNIGMMENNINIACKIIKKRKQTCKHCPYGLSHGVCSDSIENKITTTIRKLIGELTEYLD